MSSQECILGDGRRFSTALSAAQAVRSPSIAPQSLDTALQEVPTPPRRAHYEDTFDDIANRPVSEERPVSRILPTHFVSSAKLKNTFLDQLAVILALVENAVVRLFGDTGQATESDPDTKVISAIKASFNIASA